MVKKQKKKEPIPTCKSCGSDQVDKISYETLSADSKPITEIEIRCRVCNVKSNQ